MLIIPGQISTLAVISSFVILSDVGYLHLKACMMYLVSGWPKYIYLEYGIFVLFLFILKTTREPLINIIHVCPVHYFGNVRYRVVLTYFYKKNVFMYARQ